MKRFYFTVVVWGEQYCRYLTDFCIPSWLSPGNIPALRGYGHKFLVACPLEDFWQIQSHPNVEKLSQYLTVEHVPIPKRPQNAGVCQHMGIGHIKMTEKAYSDKAVGVLMTPDMVISDGAVNVIQREIRNGKSLVLTCALRFATERFFKNYKGPWDNINPRELTKAAIDSIHRETRSYEYTSEKFNKMPSAAWWRVNDGMLIHTLSWNALAVDYAKAKSHDIHTLQHWSIDGDYLYRNFGDSPDTYCVQDSDELIQVSWGKENAAPDRDYRMHRGPFRIYKPLMPYMGRTRPGSGSVDEKAHSFRNAFYSKTFDNLKRRLFFRPVFWHKEDLTEDWKDKAALVRSELFKALHIQTEEQAWQR